MSYQLTPIRKGVLMKKMLLTALIVWFVKNICGLGLGLPAFQVYDIT